MRWFSGSKGGLVLAVFIAALVLASLDVKADFTFGTPSNLGAAVNSSVADVAPSAAADGLSLYFASERTGGYGGGDDIWVARRETTDDEWGLPINIGSIINSSACEMSPCISADGLSLFFADGIWEVTLPQRPGGYGNADLWVAMRSSQQDEWRAPVNLGSSINSPYYDGEPAISADGLELYFSSDRPGGQGSLDLYVATRETKQADWGPPVNLGATINSSDSDGDPTISTSGLQLFFASSRPGGSGHFDLWMITRPTTSGVWSCPVNLGPTANGPGPDWGPDISADGRMLYLCCSNSSHPGGIGSWDLWQVPITPIVDFNTDGIVDLGDFAKLAQRWGQNEVSVDVAPPIGNGIVDIQDVAVLAEHWLEGAGPFAHWKLDETEGATACDSVGDYDATVHGDAVWQPADGQTAGALEFDGIDDYVSTEFVLDPADTAFSVFLWMKGGAAGQVILSQIGAANWLMADAEGKLMTELKDTGRFGRPLFSQTVVTDGQWHRLGLTWNGSNRVLYVDGVAVAQDTQRKLGGSTGGLYIGAGKDREPGSLWSGLIDDVRVYDRAVTP